MCSGASTCNVICPGPTFGYTTSQQKGNFPFLLAVGQTCEMALDEMIQYADRLGLNETEPVLIELE